MMGKAHATIAIARGVREGDPAPMVLFCLGAAPFQVRISKNCWGCLHLKLERADDCLYGIRNATIHIARLFQLTQSLEAAFGFALNIHKCLISSPCSVLRSPAAVHC
eukprot:1270741-Pyramimonas_sp.AAC.1